MLTFGLAITDKTHSGRCRVTPIGMGRGVGGETHPIVFLFEVIFLVGGGELQCDEV